MFHVISHRYSMKKRLSFFFYSLPVLSISRSDKANGWSLMECESRPRSMENARFFAFSLSFNDGCVFGTRFSVYLMVTPPIWCFSLDSVSDNWYCHTLRSHIFISFCFTTAIQLNSELNPMRMFSSTRKKETFSFYSY